MARPAAALAVANVLLTLGAGVYMSAALNSAPGTTAALMRSLDSQPEVFVVSDVIQGVAFLLLVGPLAYLFRVVKFRRPDTPDFVLPLLLLGSLLLAVAGVASQLDQFDNAREFLSNGSRSEDRANDLILQRGPLSQGLGLGGSLAFSVSVMLLSVRAIGAGVLSRFMGTIGVVVGALFVLSTVLPIGGAGFVQLFWVVALGLLFLGRWPGGRGPAWESGEAIAWPSAAERREAAVAGSVPVDDPRDPIPASEARDTEDEARDTEDEAGEDEAAARPHPVSKKRKRKRRS